ncbi:NHLP leader peptide family RiPP precursor [Paenibacillus flagellatus]|uniref:NHLP leader peptide family natural product n=1 Tax=Paenibacillus flagellatus TaxID=2211139 RepID=A0A2V5K8R0_9BACL|nr:NHLP leader peptide family RiPP precursor [Paenibacillus flagellatus]PYI55899.1 NHLP leader peptide family natural product precursor [Paenibacillus flagellatus]
MSAEQQLKQQIIEKAWGDPVFKQKLLDDPKGAIREAFGIDIPDHIELKAVEEKPDQYVLVIPPNPAETLSDGSEETDTDAAW